VTAFTEEQVMLTLAGVTYRGFHDPGRGEGHDVRVRDAVEAGLRALAPVREDWELAWGPVTSRGPAEHLDTNAICVMRHARERHRYVVAIRGTNPLSLSDWLLGDFWVNATVPWPYAPPADGAAVSVSTALGLAVLQTLRARPLPASSAGGLAWVGPAIGRLARKGATALGRLDGPRAQLRATIRAQLSRPIEKWLDTLVRSEGLEAVLRKLAAVPDPMPTIRRPRCLTSAGADLDLLSYLGAEAASSGAALDVTVTGHSKGGALAQSVALWLREALDAPDERWDAGHGARIHCHAFAGPTPGNAAFARRFEGALGATHHHLRNMHDVVTRAWQVDELSRIPALYGSRTALFKPLVERLVARIGPLGYAHVQPGARQVEGPLLATRSFPEELIHQHVDAYLAALGLDALGIDALSLFVG
jgi:Lipase (class 3)